MPTLEVLPRPTPEERAETIVPVDVEDELAAFAETIEEWAAPRSNWEFRLQEGHEFGRANNVEGRLLFVAGARAVLDPARDDEELSLLELDVSVAKLDRQAALQDEEEVVGVGMRMPDELAFHLDHGELVVVEVADDPRCEAVVEGRELRSEVDRVVHAYSAVSICAF